MNIEEDSLETKVCTSYDEQVQTVLLLSKAGYSQTNPDQTFIAEIANLNLQNVESYFISPIEFNFINIQELGQLISTVNKWHGIILTSIRCVDALIQSFNLLSEREIILAKWQQSTIFTVGDATKQYLLDKLHLDSIGHQSSNSETLAKFILDLNREQPIKLPLLYPCSNIRSESISKSLQGIIPLHEVFCYETIPNQHLEQEMKMFRQHIDRKLPSLDEIHLKNCKLLLIVVFFSPSGVMNLFPHICRDLLSLNNTLVVKFVAFGNVTAAKMTDLGIEVWFVSSEPKIKTLAREIEIRLIERLNE